MQRVQAPGRKTREAEEVTYPTRATKYHYTVPRRELRALQAVEPVSARLRAIGALWNEAYESLEATWDTVIVIVDEHGKEWGACYPAEGE